MQHGRGRGLFPMYTMYIVERFTFIDFSAVLDMIHN